MKKTLVISLCCFLLASCVEQKQLERLGLITAIGYDIPDESSSSIRGTVVMLNFSPELSNFTNIITQEGVTSKGIRRALNQESSHQVVSGQLRVAVYGKEMAEQGIRSVVDSFTRDASIGNMLYLVIAEGSAEELIKFREGTLTYNFGTHLYNLIQQNVKDQQFPSPTLQNFVNTYDNPGKDPILPIMGIDEDRIGLKEIGLLKGDRLVGTLSNKELFYLLLMMKGVGSGSFDIEIPYEKISSQLYKSKTHNTTEEFRQGSVYITVDNVRTKQKIKLVKKEPPTFKVDVEIKTRVLEVTENIDFMQKKTFDILTDLANKQLEDGIRRNIAYLQEIESDPIGFGSLYQAKERKKELSQDEWVNLFKRSTFDVNVKTEFIRTGVTD